MLDNLHPDFDPDAQFKEDLALLMKKHNVVGVSIMALKQPPDDNPHLAMIGIMYLHNSTPMATDITGMFCDALVGVKEMLEKAHASSSKPSLLLN